MTKGWRLESARHSLARRGIETGKKTGKNQNSLFITKANSKGRKLTRIETLLLADFTIMVQTSRALGLFAKKTGATKSIRKAGAIVIKDSDKTLKQIETARRNPTRENFEKILFKESYFKEKTKKLNKLLRCNK